MMIRNHMEISVNSLLPEVLHKFKGVCTCSNCVDDIKAKALNNLRPMYVVTELGDVYAKLNEMQFQFKSDVVSELVKAIEIISKNPRHD
jgi:competence protein ComFB